MANNADQAVIERSKKNLVRWKQFLEMRKLLIPLVDDILNHYENYRKKPAY